MTRLSLKCLMIALGVLVSLALNSCRLPEIDSWVDASIQQRSLGKVMILGIAESHSISRQYEDLFSVRLGEMNIDASPRHGLCPTSSMLDKGELAQSLRKNGFSSILVTRLVSETEKWDTTYMDTYPPHYDNYYGFYAHAYRLNTQIPMTSTYMEYIMETNLYDVETEHLIWSCRATVYNDRSNKTNMSRVIDVAIRDLKRKKLL